MRVNLPTLNASQVGRPRYRLHNPIRTGILYQFRQWLYDYYGVNAATVLNEQRLFTIPLGQQFTPAGGAALTKTIWHTNMTQASVLPSPEKLFVKAIQLSWANDIQVTDANRFSSDAILDFLISGRSYSRGHAFKYPAAGGVYGFSAATLSNGVPDARNQFVAAGALGEVVEQLQSIAVDLIPQRVVRADAGATYTTAAIAAGGTGINAHVFADGLLSREVN